MACGHLLGVTSAACRSMLWSGVQPHSALPRPTGASFSCVSLVSLENPCFLVSPEAAGRQLLLKRHEKAFLNLNEATLDFPWNYFWLGNSFGVQKEEDLLSPNLRTDKRR